ncbi:hypothetical protein CA265_04340 [Sphingobacteriaceae bacterium GW460-11-11-14-LB5]|nr:hypothetical protein CA265_04340 [Sphingobacteriaceae bacterium GW460-11-11-14-LB5]
MFILKVLCFSKLNRKLINANLFCFLLVDVNGQMAHGEMVHGLAVKEIYTNHEFPMDDYLLNYR